MRWTTESTGEMAMIADPRIVRRERFLANMATRRATVRLQLFFRQRFHGYVGGCYIFNLMRQIIELSREPRYAIFIATEPIQ